MALSIGTLGYFGVAAQGIASVFNAFSAKSVTKYNNAVAQAQADIARINARSMEMAYNQRLFAAESEYQRESMAAGRTKARQKTVLAANGVAVGEGSAAEIQASTDIIKQIDLNRIEKNAKTEAWGYKSKAVDYENQAIMAEARKQSVSSVFNNTLLGGLSQTAFGLAANRLAINLSRTETKTEPVKEPKTYEVDAISSAQPNLTMDDLANNPYMTPVKTTQMYKTTNRYSPFYGVK